LAKKKEKKKHIVGEQQLCPSLIVDLRQKNQEDFVSREIDNNFEESVEGSLLSAFDGDSTAEDQFFLDQAHGAAATNVTAPTKFQNLYE
jgi:hypothetical protein